jgi:guanylate kinase
MAKLLGSCKQGLAFVVSAPAGTGKTTLVQMLVKEFSCVVESISYTTRKPRKGEMPGVHYHFISEEEFQQRIAADDFLEYVNLYGNFYGTSRRWVQEQQGQGKHIMLVIDTQGALQLRSKFHATFIFIKPPSMDELKKRLVQRQTECFASIEERLAWANREIEDGRFYDYQIVNDNLDVAYQVLKSIVIAEEHRVIQS